jgi:hypothetical protein
MADFVLNARERNEVGKGASRRLRRLAKEVPAIVERGVLFAHPDTQYWRKVRGCYSERRPTPSGQTHHSPH